ncbi:adenylate/guanylate cyclase domain-containing protein [Nocardioides sp. WS12]|uniref:adenylate/guanylate cyclase domain-containing protein n=1 Tax=Nocardioides sp. WS12 TaxID=2486272 RepID=UPI0015FB61CD|nr:adenylate/guanylate cyclase domain-containing protein [Nocardioides sp. WS12]
MTRRRRMGRVGAWWLRAATVSSIVVINIGGACAILPIASFVVPLPTIRHEDAVKIANLWLTVGYVTVAIAFGVWRGLSLNRKSMRWFYEHREPTDAERRAVLTLPQRVFRIQGSLWLIAALVFAAFNARYDITLGVLVGISVSMAGMLTSSLSYLVTERLTRPFARRALASGVPRRVGMRVGARTFLAWLLGSGTLILGMCLSAITALGLSGTTTVEQLAVTVLVLGGIAFVLGGFTIWMAAKASSDPIKALRKAVYAVQRGHLSTEVPIYDGTEVGVLQAGFNEMVHGLREREQIRDLFGRHVGPDVARAALENGVRLGGEVRNVGALFVDIIGSTTMATNRPPEEVVALLNQFFAVVIDVVHTHGGLINKFEGDAALAVWGAPTPAEGLEQSLLTAARVMGERLRAEVPELRAGIGVSAGPAVAGNVGAAERYEYTVIGDPINEAARLTDLAKDVPLLVLARGDLLDAAGDEAAYWTQLEPVVVRGRTEPTPIATPTSGDERKPGHHT